MSNPKLQVYINAHAREFLWAFIKQVKTEVGGFGYGRRHDAGFIEWYDTFVVPQTVSSSEVDFMKSGIPYAIERATKDDVLGKDDFVWIKWHSHHTMNAYWSSVDDRANEQLRAAGIPYLIDFVGNHAYEYKIRAELYDNRLGLPQITIDDVEWQRDPDDSLECQVARELEAHVKEKPKSSTGTWTKSSTGTWKRNEPGEKVEQALVKRESESAAQDMDAQAWGELDAWTDIEKEELHEMLSQFTDLQLREMGITVNAAGDVIQGEVVS